MAVKRFDHETGLETRMMFLSRWEDEQTQAGDPVLMSRGEEATDY